MTPAQHKAFSEACTRFGDDLAKIFGTEAPRDWEILEFRYLDDGTIARINSDKTYGPSRTLEAFLQKGICVDSCDVTIHSIRRLSDNTVCTLGDKACYSTNGLQCEIQKFWLEGEKMMVETSGFISSIAELVEPRKPLFTTADGVEVFKGDIVYHWLPDGAIVSYMAPPGILSVWYSSQEAAEKAYKKWLADQPVLSLNDVGFFDLGEANWNNLLDTVKQKLSKK